jgi:hypothetical protein
MSGPIANPAGFRLPAACVDLAAQLSGQFGVPSHLLLACFPLALGVAAGPCRLDTGIWSQPINGALDLAIGVHNDKAFRLAVDHVLAPSLTALESTIARRRSNDARKSKPASLVIGDKRLPERAIPGGDLTAELARHRATVVANLKPGQLQQVASRHSDDLTLAVYDDAHFLRLTHKAKSRAERDLALLRSGLGPTTEMFTRTGSVDTIRPPVSCLTVCSENSLGRFIGSRKALVSQLADQFLFQVDWSESSPAEAQPYLLQDRSLDAWVELYLRVADACSFKEDVLIGMTAASGQLLLDYLREELKAKEAPRQAELGPLVAAKLAMCFHLCLASPKPQVGPDVMRDAIGMARWLVQTSAQAKSVLVELNLKQHAQHLIERMPNHGPVRWRALCRRFKNQATAFHRPAADWSVAKGAIVRHPDGSLERVSR